MPGKPDWGGGALAAGSNTLIAVNGVTVGQNLTSVKTATVSRPGYVFQIGLVNSTSGSVEMPVRVRLNWSDSASGVVVARQVHNIMAGSPGNSHFVTGTGPTSGNTLSVDVTNACASADTLTYGMFIAEVTGIFTSHDWRTDDEFFFTIAGLTSLNNDLVSGVLAETASLSLLTGANTTRVMPYYTGPVWAFFNTASGTSDLTVSVSAHADSALPAAFNVWQAKTDATGNVSARLWLPRAQCTFKAVNGNAGTQTIQVSLVTAPGQPG